MSENIYAPPIADVDVAVTDAAPFYVVGRRKFLILFIGTLGLYGIYWFYRHWSAYKAARQLDIWPIPRAIFAIFFTHSLFAHIDTELDDESHHKWQPMTAATLFVVISILTHIADRLAAKGIAEPWADVASIAGVPLAAIALLEGQKAANAACGDPAGRDNSSLSIANYAWLLPFALLWLLVLFGLVLVLSPELLG